MKCFSSTEAVRRLVVGGPLVFEPVLVSTEKWVTWTKQKLIHKLDFYFYFFFFKKMHRANSSSTFLRRQLSYWPYRRITFHWKIELAVFINKWFSYFIIFHSILSPKVSDLISQTLLCKQPSPTANESKSLRRIINNTGFAGLPTNSRLTRHLGATSCFGSVLPSQISAVWSSYRWAVSSWVAWLRRNTHRTHVSHSASTRKKSADTRACSCVLIYSP